MIIGKEERSKEDSNICKSLVKESIPASPKKC